MKALIRIVALSLLIVPAVVSAQEPQPVSPFNGYWEGTIEETSVLVELRVQGEIATGPIFVSGFGERYIREGAVAGNTIQFITPHLDPTPEDQAPRVVWNGQLAGDELAFSIANEGGSGPAREFVLRRRVR
jgi:hypothetical protein